jgi:hypothetical protein
LTVDAQETTDSVTLWIRHSDKKLVDTKDVTVSVAGKNQGRHPPERRQLLLSDRRPARQGCETGADGRRPRRNPRAARRSGAPAGGHHPGLLGSHNQLWWRVINLGVLFIGVLALSRRKSY